MSTQAITFRLYSVLETSRDGFVYDVLDVSDTDTTLHSHISIQELDTAFLKYFKQSDNPVTLLIPAELAREVQLGVIPGNQSKALQAAPFLVEESLACDLNSTHIALGRDPNTRQTSAVIIQHATLQQCLAEFASADIIVGAIYRDIDTLKKDNHSRLRIAGRRAIIESMEQCTVVATANLEFYIEALGDQRFKDELNTLQIYLHTASGAQASEPPGFLSASPISYCDDHWFPEQFQLAGDCINLAQGQYAPKVFWMSLRLSQWMFIGCVYLALAVLTGSYYGFAAYYDRGSQRLHDNQVTLYKMLFPQDKKIVNLRAQFSQHVNYMGGNENQDRFTELLYTSLNQFGAITDLASGGIRKLQYQSAPPVLDLEVLVDSVKKLDTFEHSLSKKGLTLRIESINQKGDAFVSRIQVSADCYQC